MNSVSKLLCPSEATEKLGISYSSLLRLIKAGKIPSIRIGKQIRIPSEFFHDLESKAMESIKGVENE